MEKNAAAPDLATIKARFGNLPGLVLKVKGEKTGAPNVWFTGDVEKYADEIKAAGSIWSKKKAAYWVKPSAAQAPAEDKPATPITVPSKEKATAAVASKSETAPRCCVALCGWYKTPEKLHGYCGFRSIRDYESECVRLEYQTRRVYFQREGEKFFALITYPPVQTSTSVASWNLITYNENFVVLNGVIQRYTCGDEDVDTMANRLSAFGCSLIHAGYEDFDTDENGQVILPF